VGWEQEMREIVEELLRSHEKFFVTAEN
jgi:hypothetical protein